MTESRYNDYCGAISKGIQAEIKLAKPFSSLEEEAYLSLLSTAEELQQRAADFLEPHGLSPTQYNALRILRGAGERGLACREVGKRMVHRDPDITRLLDRLERRGLVTRSRDKKDRRVITARISPAGLAILQGLDREMDNFPRRLLGDLGEGQLRSLTRMLQTVRESCTRRGVEALNS